MKTRLSAAKTKYMLTQRRGKKGIEVLHTRVLAMNIWVFLCASHIYSTSDVQNKLIAGRDCM